MAADFTREGRLSRDGFGLDIAASPVHKDAYSELRRETSLMQREKIRKRRSEGKRRAGKTERPIAPAEICSQLKEAILRQDYPPGSRLSEDDLAQRFHVSRTPIREALKQLEIEGLVVRMRFHGGWVKQLRPEEVIELLDLREVLEGLLARLATERISEDALTTLDGLLAQMRSSVAAGQYNAYLEQALKFRDILITESRNTLLSAVARNMYDRMRLIGNRTVHLPGRAAAAIADHEKLLNAMHARDPERAEAINRERIKAIKRDAAKAFTESAFW